MAEHEKPGLGERFKYRFDNLMSKGMLGKFFLLGLLSIVFIFIIFVLTRIFESTPMDPGKQLWVTLMRTFDPGNLNGDEEVYSKVFVFFMLLATLYGIFSWPRLSGLSITAWKTIWICSIRVSLMSWNVTTPSSWASTKSRSIFWNSFFWPTSVNPRKLW